MATYNSSVWNTTFGPTHQGSGGHIEIVGSVTIPDGTALATADVINLFRVRSGAFVRNIWLVNDDFGTDVPGTFGHYKVSDGTAIDADSVTVDVDLEDAQTRKWENGAALIDTAAGSGARLGAVFQAPFTELSEDAAFRMVLGTVSTPTTSGARRIRFIAEVIFWGDRGQTAYDWNGNASGSLVTE